jgi:hypothetical protein
MSRQEDRLNEREDEVLGAMMRAVRKDEPEAPEFSRMWERARYEVREQDATGVPWMALVAGALLALGFAIVSQSGQPEVTRAKPVERASATEVRQQLAREHTLHAPASSESMTWEAPTDFLLAGPLDDDSGLMSDAPDFGEVSL